MSTLANVNGTTMWLLFRIIGKFFCEIDILEENKSYKRIKLTIYSTFRKIKGFMSGCKV